MLHTTCGGVIAGRGADGGGRVGADGARAMTCVICTDVAATICTWPCKRTPTCALSGHDTSTSLPSQSMQPNSNSHKAVGDAYGHRDITPPCAYTHLALRWSKYADSTNGWSTTLCSSWSFLPLTQELYATQHTNQCHWQLASMQHNQAVHPTCRFHNTACLVVRWPNDGPHPRSPRRGVTNTCSCI
jgi:hypothetical protein